MERAGQHTPRLAVGRAIVPSFSRLKNEDERAHYRGCFLALWPNARRGVRGATGLEPFPGCNPCSLSRASMEALRAAPYKVSIKSDGVRYALLLTCRPGADMSPVALMIDRSWQMYEVEVVAPEDYFTFGTILEGELVWQQPDERRMTYLVFDAIVVRGRPLTDAPFEERIAEATRCTRLSDELASLPPEHVESRCVETESIVLVHYDPPITMRPKNFVLCQYASRLWRERRDVDHRIDGLIMNRCDSPYTLGTAYDRSMLKWKVQSTVDLQGVNALLHTRNGPLPHKIHDRDVVVLDSRITASSPMDIREFLVTVQTDTIRLFPLRQRPDKTHPNSEAVVVATMHDVIEDISIDELALASESAANV